MAELSDEQKDADAKFWEWLGKNYSPEQVSAFRGEAISDEEAQGVWNYFVTNVYNVEPPPLSRSEKAVASFRDWAKTKYNANELTAIEDNADVFNQVFSFYANNILGTRFDIGYKPTAGRPQSEASKLITEKEDKRADTMVQAFIIQSKAALAKQEEAKAEARRGAGGYSSVEAMRQAISQTGVGITGAERPQVRQPQDYGPAFGKFTAGLRGEGPESAFDWFESRFPSLIRQYETQYPVGEEKQAGDVPWSEFLEGQKPALKEQRAKLSPYERGERPGAYAQRIQTIDL